MMFENYDEDQKKNCDKTKLLKQKKLVFEKNKTKIFLPYAGFFETKLKEIKILIKLTKKFG